ncbi:hypothetical protein ARMGADRAFT_487612 [Armillaria gallica]|uniref:SWIRM domain-containing protein n=1 Tax=Armillaria gallica TaxID=47427 RepID=A0A2H3ECN8_ARMGA|nr:hypothetical protein ARMGADRAFT_487612 [Armillaria gallica]
MAQYLTARDRLVPWKWRLELVVYITSHDGTPKRVPDFHFYDQGRQFMIGFGFCGLGVASAAAPRPLSVARGSGYALAVRYRYRST